MKKLLQITFIVLLFSFNSKAQTQFTDIGFTGGMGEIAADYGVAFLDFDNDGWEDIYVTRWRGANKLYRNLGNETFEDVAVEAGVAFEGTSKGVNVGDVNNDGWLDIFVGNRDERDVLFLNQGDGSFEDVSIEVGLLDAADVWAAAFADINSDGLLDLYVARISMENTMYLNMGLDENGVPSFVDVVESSNTGDRLNSMGAIFFDYDQDNDQDLYLVHDGMQANILYENDGQGKFTNVSEVTNANYAGWGMGVDVGDFNRDGWMDIFITNLYPNFLLQNNGGETFVDIAESASTTDDGMGWGTAFLDVDNDGWQDIYLVNDPGHNNVLYHNQGDDTFLEVSRNTPLGSLCNSYGLASADINNDGRIDVFIANSYGDEPSRLLKNDNLTDNNWVKVKAVGVESNRAGIGTRVVLQIGETILVDEVSGGSSWASQNSLILHFGLGTAEKVDEMKVYWSSGVVDVYKDIEVNQFLEVTERETIAEDEESSTAAISDFQLDFQIAPNPSTGEFYVSYEIQGENWLTFHLYDSFGRHINSSRTKFTDAGTYIRYWELPDLGEGLYYCVMEFGEQRVVKKWVRFE